MSVFSKFECVNSILFTCVHKVGAFFYLFSYYFSLLWFLNANDHKFQINSGDIILNVYFNSLFLYL